MNTTDGTGTEAGTTALPAEWTAFIGPFATAIGVDIVDTTERLKPLIGEPNAEAIGFLQTEADTPFDLIRERFPGVATAKLKRAVTGLRAQAEVATQPGVMATALNALPEVPGDDAWLKSLQTGGVLLVGKPTVIAAARAGLGNRLGLFELPGVLLKLMESTAESLDQPVGPEFFKLRNLLTRKRYGEIFAALEGQEGLDAKFVTQTRKDKFLSRVDQELWPALIEFQAQVKNWVEGWQSQVANPAMFMTMLAGAMNGGGAGMPPGLVGPPPADALRDGAQGVINKINRVFAGLGTPIAAALAYEAMKIREVLENPSLPLLVGAQNRDDMLKKCKVAVTADYVRLEKGITQYILGVMDLPDVPVGQETAFIGAMFQLGSQIPWGNLTGSASRTAGRPFTGRREE